MLVLSCILHASAFYAMKTGPPNTLEDPVDAPELLRALDTDLDGCVGLEEIDAAFSRLNITRLLKWVRHGAELPEIREPFLEKGGDPSLESGTLAKSDDFDRTQPPVKRGFAVPKQRAPEQSKSDDPTRTPNMPLALSHRSLESAGLAKNAYANNRTKPVERNANVSERGHELRKSANSTLRTPLDRLPHLHRGLDGAFTSRFFS